MWGHVNIVGHGCDYDLHYVLRYTTLKGNNAPSKNIYRVLAVRVKT